MNASYKLAVMTVLLGGTMPLLPTQARTLSELYSFKGGADGQEPWAGVIMVGNELYGTTLKGGAAGVGTVFAVDANTGRGKLLHSFGAGTDGASPYAGLTYEGGVLWGTTYGGGTGGVGTVFTVNPATGVEKVVYSFGGRPDGAYPYANLLFMNGGFYGTTSYGGQLDAGSIFQLDPNTGIETILWNFGQHESDGQSPQAGLIAVGQALYGTTTQGGEWGNGAVFKYNYRSGPEKILYSFGLPGGGAAPMGALVNKGGTLFGTTACPPNDGCEQLVGTVFSYDLKTASYSQLYNFQGKADGEYPQSALNYYRGALFGTTSGGNSNGGTIFKLNPATKALTILHTFPDYTYPFAGLLDQNGAFYGTTGYGGKHKLGSVFKFTP
jgi:uncharacterized repeat protein (TIGR03803 family)